MLVSLKSTVRVWVAWDLPSSNREKINHGSRTVGGIIVTGSCTERSEPLKSSLLNLSDEPAQVMYNQNCKFKFDEVKAARLRKDSRVGGHRGDGNHSSSPLRENQTFWKLENTLRS